MMRRKVVCAMGERRRNRRVMLALYSDGSWKIVTKQLVRDAEGKLAISRRDMPLTERTMGAVVAMYVQIANAQTRLRTQERAKEATE